MARQERWLTVLLLLCMGLAIGSESAEGQFRGRRGDRLRGSSRFGRGPGGGGLIGQLFRESVRDELKLTEEQLSRIRELTESSGAAMRDLFGRMRGATDEERDAIRAEIEKAQAELRKKAEAELEQILSPAQFVRAQQLDLQRAGVRALNREEIAADLKLSDDQKQKMKAAFESLDQKRREMFEGMRGRRDLPREQRDQMFAEMREKSEEFQKATEAEVLALLTLEQKEAWTRKLGPPPADAATGPEGAHKPEETHKPMMPDGPAKPEVARLTPQRPARTYRPEASPAGSDSPQKVIVSLDPAQAADRKPDAAKPGGSDGTTSPETDPAAKGDAKRMSFNFRLAPWEDVLKLFAESAGLTLDLTDVPPGTFNYYDTGLYTPDEALDILNGYLLQRGYVLVHRDRFLVVVNIGKGIPPNLVPSVSLEELPQRGRNELLSVVFPLEGRDAEQAAKDVKTLLGPQGTAVGLPKSESLVVTDIGSNLARVQRFLTGLSPAPETLTFRNFPLQHIAATDAEKIVRSQLGLSQSVPNVSAAASGETSRSRDWRREMFERIRSRFDPRSRGSESSRSSSRSSSQPSGQNKAQVTADPRTNSLLVTATAAQLKIVEAVVKAIDVEENSARQRLAVSNDTPQLKVYEVNSADAREVAKTLSALMPGVVINEDGRARRLHIYATPKDQREIEHLIRQLDGEDPKSVAVIPLSRLDAFTVASTLQSLFIRDAERAPIIQTDISGRRLIMRGTLAQITQAKTVLAQLGEDGSGYLAEGPTMRGPVRTIPLGGRDPQEVLRLIERFWPASNQNPIRVVVPSGGNLIRRQRPPLKERSEIPGKSGEEIRPDRGKADRRDSRAEGHADAPIVAAVFSKTKQENSQRNPRAEETKDPPAEETKKEQRSPQTAPKAPVSVSVSGGNLIVASEDEDALDRLERLIEMLTRGLPAKTGWTVFYLRSADATETAAMLEQILDDTSVSTPTSTGSSGILDALRRRFLPFGGSPAGGSGLSDSQTGPLTLRIIPEVRSNALFVSGPAEKVRDVEELLKILDASELPESLRDRVPRMIPVEYADVSDVATIVSEVYKDDMGGQNQNQNTRGSRGFDPRAIFMGRGSNRNQQSSAVRLTLGVDTRTNQLVVSASDSLFRQIQILVESLDQAAREAKRTVRVVAVGGGHSLVVQQALSSLFSKVKVSTTAPSKSGTKPASSAGSPSAGNQPQRPSGRPSPDDIRRFFEQRMRERMQRGNFGPRPGDGGRPDSRRGDRRLSPFGSPGRSR